MSELFYAPSSDGEVVDGVPVDPHGTKVKRKEGKKGSQKDWSSARARSGGPPSEDEGYH